MKGEGKLFILFQSENQGEKVPMFVMAHGGVSGVYDRAVGASSLSAAGGGARLVEAHRFAQPAGKVHFLHL